MVPPDYQEFANRQPARCRDNSVICRACATRTIGNQPSVARLPRRFKSTKAELSINVGAAYAPGGARNCWKTEALEADFEAKLRY
jgi:hypothetical protein